MPNPPRPASSAAPAQWLSERVSVASRNWVRHSVGPGYEAYARILHPQGDAPRLGTLAPDYLEPLVGLLAARTTTPDRCWFAVWHGWGWWDGPGAVLTSAPRGTTPPPVIHAPDDWQLDRTAPRFDLP